MDGVLEATVVATVSKHVIGGIIALAIGAVIIVLGVLRIAAKTAMAFLLPLAGLVVVIIGILLFTRTI